MQIKMSVNERRLVNVLEQSFSTSTTFIGELMQNARRAGATHIAIRSKQLADGTFEMSFTDDGCGIQDWTNLFNIATSGWDDETIQNEGAFGIGFISALFAAKDIEIASNGHRFQGQTQTVLSMEEFQLESSDSPEQGTYIMLSGVSGPIYKGQQLTDAQVLENKIKLLASGFPIPVIFNGTELARPNALVKSNFISSDIGYIRLEKLEQYSTTRTVLYLQGMLLGYEDSSEGRVQTVCSDQFAPTIVHLDPQQFVGRLPDRNVLVDSHEKLEVIQEALRQARRDRLKQLKEELTEEQFIGYFQQLSGCQSLDLLNDMNIVPTHVFSAITLERDAILENNKDVLDSWRFHEQRFGEIGGSDKRTMTRQELASMLRPIFSINDVRQIFGSKYDWDHRVDPRMLYLSTLDAWFYNDRLDKNHWIHKLLAGVQPLVEQGCIDMRPTTTCEAVTIKTDWQELKLSACDSIQLEGPMGITSVSDWYVEDPKSGTTYAVGHPGWEALGAVVPFRDEYDDLDLGAWEKQGMHASDQIASFKKNGVCGLLAIAVEDSRVASTYGLANTQFKVSFDEEGVPSITKAA